jgi:DNA-binding transcriptional MerR regulator
LAEPTPIFQARAGKLVTIGQVLALLTPEFPELTQSKLRFLEENGLITPQRTDSGYRKFAEADVERLKLILELQRDRYLPLKVIGQFLADLDAGKSAALPGDDGKPNKHARVAQVKNVTRIELIAETSITDALIVEAQSVGLISEEPFNANTIEIARSIMKLSRGFGLTPRHLRGIKTAADREIGLIEGIVAPVLAKKEASSKSKAAHFAEELQSHFASIREELIRGAISKIDD